MSGIPAIGRVSEPSALRLSWLKKPGVGRLLAVILVLALWEAAARWMVDPRFLAGPSAMFAAIPGLFQVRGLPAALATTLGELVASFGLSVLIGAPLGLWLGLSIRSRRRVLPIILLLYAVPQVTILPLIVMIFGIGAASKIAFGVTHAVFPIVFTISAAAQNLDRVLLNFAHLHGATRRQTLRHVILPQIAPTFFSGMRLAMVGAILGVLLAELYASSGGIGAFTRIFSDTFQAANLFALVFLLSAMAVCLNEALRFAEARFQRR
ncbi:ABC transporter permease [Rhizobium rhizogenes]|uniref:ABC transporter permease n=1 Tax=Rhizobium rhizogenes TaxID=359 RepID=UPI001574E5A9|nr:ABC transporter permease subunit [Rhizobium rhizogenes]NTI78473.1 ABC transporter permease subunit [Rhizobium rhizogenes]